MAKRPVEDDEEETLSMRRNEEIADDEDEAVEADIDDSDAVEVDADEEEEEETSRPVVKSKVSAKASAKSSKAEKVTAKKEKPNEKPGRKVMKAEVKKTAVSKNGDGPFQPRESSVVYNAFEMCRKGAGAKEKDVDRYILSNSRSKKRAKMGTVLALLKGGKYRNYKWEVETSGGRIHISNVRRGK